ncbi:LacI family transcriptional regulator [Sphingobium jiangsuense]|uniref:DNA-binding LacI/PurR family transcriptional regulator n=1 Tax=Sphingobium jiangsuense TaxID=870476 RepID=A0A7W6BRN3_9SPHN|nr:LacI family DNA-binding transcriptional regulator [Sphingobium jiangsuense]MBB3928552.1 DNA-binding LacI/PurR family transcriptional regulator [Sphingobium jiangsuense]GLT00913.1 LacI family transcriptional regulator [Sphingobium jiangsuense]
MNDRIFVTAHDVAREAGVSQSAVSRAFTPGARIAADTRERILATAERLGYRPNLLARSLINGRSNIVGVGVGDLGNPFFVQTLQLLSNSLNEAGLRLLMFPAEGDAGSEPSIREILHYRLDALVLLSVGLSSTLAEECRKAQVPVILYNRTTRDQDASSVIGDNATGARTIAAHLLAGEHRRIAYLAGTEGSSTNVQRESAFYAYMAEQDAPEPIRENGQFRMEAATAATRRLLTARDRPDAIFCANDTMAIAAINVARHEFGLDVGRELSIVGYDDVPMAAWPAFSLTSYSQPAQAMVDETVRLIHALRAAPASHERVMLEGSLVVRGSSRAVRPHAA